MSREDRWAGRDVAPDGLEGDGEHDSGEAVAERRGAFAAAAAPEMLRDQPRREGDERDDEQQEGVQEEEPVICAGQETIIGSAVPPW